jgi:quercetin dioxygenase-like cupin family protein
MRFATGVLASEFILAILVLSGCATHESATAGAGQGIEPSRSAHAQEPMTPPSSNAAAAAADPTVTDPDKYKAVMENERVRVLRYHDGPGAKTHQHWHPASVLYALSDFRRRLIFPDGTVKERDFRTGDVMWIPAQTHIGQNIGDTATEVLLVEMK